MIQNSNSKQFKNIFLFLFCVCFAILPLVAEGAILYLEPSSGEYQLGDTFGVKIKIDTEGECINAIEGNLRFSQDILKVVDFSQGNSIIALWAKLPEINQESGLVSFSGGIPNGYCGRVLGDPKTSNLLGKIIFRVPEALEGKPRENLAEVGFLNTSQVLLNDGKGTKAKLITQGAALNILAEKPVIPKDEWKEEIEKDDILPESFKIETSQDPAIFEGKYFIVFSTTDKQTGIDHYEVKEGERDWKIAVSPYVLENQKLTDDIWIKAVDKAGNERIETIKAPKKPVSKDTLYLILILVVIIIGISWWVIRKILSTKIKKP